MISVENHLLARLPRKDRTRFIQQTEECALVLGDVLYPGGQSIQYVYFPLDGFVSLVTLLDGKPLLESGMVGREGMLGIPLTLGVKRSPSHAVVQGPGTARRIDSALFKSEFKRSAALQRDLQLYTHVVMTQLATNSACLSAHRLAARLARWLLMTQDRAHADHFRVTHEFLAYMLGVRRVGVTTAAATLQKQGLINYTRGDVTVVDRRRLEASACSCYAADRTAYAELLE